MNLGFTMGPFPGGCFSEQEPASPHAKGTGSPVRDSPISPEEHGFFQLICMALTSGATNVRDIAETGQGRGTQGDQGGVKGVGK